MLIRTLTGFKLGRPEVKGPHFSEPTAPQNKKNPPSCDVVGVCVVGRGDVYE